MRVSIISYTPIESLVKATAMPYQSKETVGLVKRVFDSGHRSVVRHGQVSFLVEGVSQSLLRQISRHPHINLTVKSSRYCSMEDSEIYIPNENINKISKKINREVESITQEYIDDMKEIMSIYGKWSKYEDGHKEADIAKLFLPLASTMDLVVSGNYQAIYEFLQLRNCTRAETEIRKLSLELTKQLKETVPEIFGELGCKGDELGYCPETHGSCGKYPLKNQ